MYFLIPGVVSQAISVFVVDGNIGRAIELVISEVSNSEVYSAILARYVGEIEQCEVRTNSILTAKELIVLENIELTELTPTVTGFIDFDSFGATQSHLRNSLETSELITLESGWLEVSGNPINAIEIETIEPIQRELQSVPITYYPLVTS